jgi:hypothetical protein
MPFADDLTSALQDAARAGAAAASTGARDLTGDIEKFVVPHIEDIAAQVAAIATKRKAGIYTDITARDLLDSQVDAIKTLIETVVTLVVLEVQQILDAVVGALSKAVNGFVGVALL